MHYITDFFIFMWQAAVSMVGGFASFVLALLVGGAVLMLLGLAFNAVTSAVNASAGD